jgi:hypothetical protein
VLLLATSQRPRIPSSQLLGCLDLGWFDDPPLGLQWFQWARSATVMQKGPTSSTPREKKAGLGQLQGIRAQLAPISMAATVEVLRVDLFQIRQLTRPRPVAGVVPLVYDFQYCGKAAAAQISKWPQWTRFLLIYCCSSKWWLVGGFKHFLFPQYMG